jgi:foldase protein PrsA
VKLKVFSVITLLVMLLAACSAAISATETSPPPTATTQPDPTATTSATPTEGETSVAAEPGGVDVALGLVNIPTQETVATVNGEAIATSDYQTELERALDSVTAQYGVDWNDESNRALLPNFQEQVLDQLIGRALLRQLASNEGIDASAEEIDAQVTSMQEQVTADPSITDWETFLTDNDLTEEDVRGLISDQILVQGLTENHGGPRVVEQIHASHILVDSEETAQEVMDKLAAGEDFGALAAEYSTDPGSKDQNGDLGWFPRGMMVPEFEAAAFSLEPGETSEPVKTDYGYHIIRVQEKGERELDDQMYAQVQQQAFQTWFSDQQAAANIERLFSFQEAD